LAVVRIHFLHWGKGRDKKCFFGITKYFFNDFAFQKALLQKSPIKRRVINCRTSKEDCGFCFGSTEDINISDLPDRVTAK
jgi:hypothetical protein